MVRWIHTNMTPEHILETFEFCVDGGYASGVQVMLEQLGLENCGGVTRGRGALKLAAVKGHVQVMQILAEAGVRDKGAALVHAVKASQRGSIFHLMRQYSLDSLNHVQVSSGATLLVMTARVLGETR